MVFSAPILWWRVCHQVVEGAGTAALSRPANRCPEVFYGFQNVVGPVIRELCQHQLEERLLLPVHGVGCKPAT
jgi:hypothetical protein